MYFFEKYPKLRLIYCVLYLLEVFESLYWYWCTIEEQGIVGSIILILFLSVWLFAIYITFVKAGILYNRNANAISNFDFDLVSIMTAIKLIYEIIKSII